MVVAAGGDKLLHPTTLHVPQSVYIYKLLAVNATEVDGGSKFPSTAHDDGQHTTAILADYSARQKLAVQGSIGHRCAVVAR